MTTETRLPDIRLGSLHRLWAAEHAGSLRKAAAYCNVDPTCMSDSIQSLERALNRLFLIPTTSKFTAYGRAFAKGVANLSFFEKVSPSRATNIRVEHLQCLIAARDCDTFQRIASLVGWSRYKPHRILLELEACVQQTLLIPSRGPTLTPAAEDLLAPAEELISFIKKYNNPAPRPSKPSTKRKLPWWERTFGV